jgi:hypothetical protein
MNIDNAATGLLLLTLGVLSVLTGRSARVWRRDESRYRIGAVIFGLICIVMGILAPLGYEVRE